MVTSIFNGNRREDIWLDKEAASWRLLLVSRDGKVDVIEIPRRPERQRLRRTECSNPPPSNSASANHRFRDAGGV
jgi:hypothetical protein